MPRQIEIEQSKNPLFNSRDLALKVFLIALVFIVSSVTANHYYQNTNPTFEKVDILTRMAFDDWKIEETAPQNWHPNFIGSEQQLIRLRNPELQYVDIYVAQYHSETEGNELISSRNTIYNHKQWNKASERKRPITFLGQSFNCLEYELFNRYSRRLIWSWYRINGHSTPNMIIAKILILYHRMRGDLQTPLFIAVSSEYQYYPDSARAHMTKLLDKSKMNT